jgi:flagellar basal-body rod protein FlgC
MSLFSALDINTSGLTAQRRRAEVATSNLTNADTTRMKTPEGGPYRRKDIVFQTTTFGRAMQAADGGSEGVEVAGVIDDMSPFEMRYDPGHPDADPATGYVSYPNVNTAEEMTNLMSAARSYEANIAAISIVKTMINRTLELGR